MKITIKESGEIPEDEIIISCRRADERILMFAAQLRESDRRLTGVIGGQTHILNPQDILYIDVADKKTFLYGEKLVYETPFKLYELEERFAAEDFFRASKSSVINFAKIVSLRPDFGGRMLVTMENGEKLVVSRQYVPYIKQKLGMEG